jgi:DNA-binding transcriptional LysR family regulator
MLFRYGRGVELRHLRYLVAVAEELNFTKAARRLRVAQPALSRQIRQLEDEIGVRLFERGHRQVSLTAAGRGFLAEAREVIERSAQAVRTARDLSDQTAGRLDIGYVWGLFHSFAPGAVARFRQKYPDVSVNLFDLTATQQASALAEGRLDAGLIGFAHEADAAGLEKRRVGVCRFVAALPAGHRATRRRAVSLASLAQESFFVISEETYPGAAHVARDACVRAGFRPKILQAAERGHTILGLVAGNCGVALLPEPLRALPHPGVVFRPLTESLAGELFVAWNPRRASPRREAFVEALVAAVKC